MRTIPRACVGVAAVVACLLATAAFAQDSFDVRRHANFGAIRTYAFKPTPPMAPVENKTTTYDSPLMRDRTNVAIGAQLDARGLKRDDEHPDVYVVTRRTYFTEYTYYGGYGWGPYIGTYREPYYGNYGWTGWDTNLYAELRGTLTIDLEDAKTGELLWRGVETKHVHQTSKPERRDRRVADEVTAIFKHFPALGAVATTGVR